MNQQQNIAGMNIADLSVLVVEDSSVAQRYARAVLERMGCRVTVVDDGLEALPLLIRHDFDITLVDLGLPIMSGVELTRQLRGEEHAAGLHPMPILAVTSSLATEDAERVMAAGADGVLLKPYTPDELVGRIQGAMVHSALAVAVA